jgi:hypothetical protein
LTISTDAASRNNNVGLRFVWVLPVIAGAFFIFLGLAALTLVSSFALIPAANATSAPNCNSFNCNLQGVTLDLGPPGPFPCPPNQGVAPSTDLFVTGNMQVHSSANHFHETIEGIWTVTLANGVSYSGHIATSFGGNFNANGNAESINTLNLNGAGSDGSSVSFSMVMHITILPDGTITSIVNNTMCH